jgi:acid stress-induced BolA-like protein IbaG/YrbA
MSHDTEILALLAAAYPNVDFTLNGDGCHFQITAIGDDFLGMKKLARQKMLNNVLSPLISSGDIHAINYTILTREEANEKGL